MSAGTSSKRGPGRPKRTVDDDMQDAARIRDVALAYAQGRRGYLASLGYTSDGQVARVLNKRYRGRLGEMVNEDLRLLFPSLNPTAGAVRFVKQLERDSAEGGAPITRAEAIKHTLLWYAGMDRRNLVRALAADAPVSDARNVGSD